MKNLKFRGWDQDAHVMIDFSNPQISFGDGKIKLVFGENFHDDFYEDSIVDIPLMQFTGLKDKNGRDIYEGDILKHSPHWEDFREISVVRSIHEFCGDSGCYGSVDEIEVIGNIYEQPDLIPQTK